MNTARMIAATAAVSVASALAYNSLAPHDNTEDTTFWDTRGYDVTPASSDFGVCETELLRLDRTSAVSQNVVSPFRRNPLPGTILFIQ